MTALNGSMMNVPFRSKKQNTAPTALYADRFLTRNTQKENRNIVRFADAGWIGALDTNG